MPQELQQVVGMPGIEAVSLRQDKADAKAEEAGKKLDGHESCGWFQFALAVDGFQIDTKTWIASY